VGIDWSGGEEIVNRYDSTRWFDEYRGMQCI